MRRASRQPGFTVLELLLVVLIIGLLASILVPNLLDALHKAKQKRAMSDMRGLGVAWMSWMTDQLGAASAGSAKTYDRSEHSPLDYVDLVGFLRPSDTFFYAQDVPEFDAWGGPYQFSMAMTGAQGSALMCSGGLRSIFETCSGDIIPVESFLATEYHQDIIWADGIFVRWPMGVTKN